ncbi:peptidyl-tRNA hydrolase [Williamsoniiplasma somnilux]|uniref:Peptidyl-tRNA hydrolase n=1 Tax=Williamsoniiplasma somnilux TaxID=215578 RepID=A0A2K8NX84_9MOLU|nr:aminoacyl-tRNA hydrolase [Williamsoniiplasma somnilux]ATZ18440.1 peptidyl-tRNA hydrolase [Williamsoniiplasma somnilux]
MKLIVGLGNPGKEYATTRHNAGWIAIDMLLDKYGFTQHKEEHQADIYFTQINGEKVLLAKPLTFMNNSGVATRALMEYYKINKNDLIIIHDDKDFPIGKIQFKFQGSAAGHNGIKSEIQYLNGEDFKRLRIGIGVPLENWTIVDWVLSKMSKIEIENLKQAFALSLDFIDDWTKGESFNKIMSKYNILYK